MNGARDVPAHSSHEPSKPADILDAVPPLDVLRAGTSRAPFIGLMLLFFGVLSLLTSSPTIAIKIHQ